MDALIYRDRDWLFDCYVNKGMTFDQMAKEAKCSKRVIEKWASEKNRINAFTFKELKKLNDTQYMIVLSGTLGDGHIDKRENFPIYIESHAADEKDYIYWKYSILKDLCLHEPKYKSKRIKQFYDKSYECSESYRLETRTIFHLKDIRLMTRIEKINQLNELGLSTHILDDANKYHKIWKLCLAEYTNEEIEEYRRVCKNKFGLDTRVYVKDEKYPYLIFTRESSDKLTDIILRNIPNDLDIIQKKIMSK